MKTMAERMRDLEKAALETSNVNSTTIIDGDTEVAQLAINIGRTNDGGRDIIQTTMNAIITCHKENHAQPDHSVRLIFNRPFINEVMGSAYLTVRSVYMLSL